MGILRRIFEGPENAEKIVDGVSRGLDKIIFTKEERADANQKVSDWYLKWLEATTGASLARRYIALLVTALWAALIIAGVAVHYLSESYSAFIFSVLVDVVMQPFSIIIAFYFLTHTVREYRKGNNGS